MSRWLALAENVKENTNPLPDTPTKGDKSLQTHPQVAFCRVLSGCQVGAKEKVGDTEFSVRNEKPDTDAFEERAAICQFDGGLTRANAEKLAAQCQGFDNVVVLRAAPTSNPSKRNEKKQ